MPHLRVLCAESVRWYGVHALFARYLCTHHCTNCSSCPAASIVCKPPCKPTFTPTNYTPPTPDLLPPTGMVLRRFLLIPLLDCGGHATSRAERATAPLVHRTLIYWHATSFLPKFIFQKTFFSLLLFYFVPACPPTWMIFAQSLNGNWRRAFRAQSWPTSVPTCNSKIFMLLVVSWGWLSSRSLCIAAPARSVQTTQKPLDTA